MLVKTKELKRHVLQHVTNAKPGAVGYVLLSQVGTDLVLESNGALYCRTVISGVTVSTPYQNQNLIAMQDTGRIEKLVCGTDDQTQVKLLEGKVTQLKTGDSVISIDGSGYSQTSDQYTRPPYIIIDEFASYSTHTDPVTWDFAGVLLKIKRVMAAPMLKRPQYEGVFFSESKMLATNGAQVHYYKRPTENDAYNLIKADTIRTLVRLLKLKSITGMCHELSEHKLHLYSPGLYLQIRTESEEHHFHKVLPVSQPKTVIRAGTKPLASALKSLSERLIYGMVELYTLGNALHFADGGLPGIIDPASTKVPIKPLLSFPTMIDGQDAPPIRLDVVHLQQALMGRKTTVIEIIDPKTAITIRSDSKLSALIMPLC